MSLWTRTACVLTLLTLTACATSGVTSKAKPEWPPIPGDIKAEAQRIVPPPKAGAMSKGQVVSLVVALRRSEEAKRRALGRLIRLYERQGGAARHPQ